jgi:hypothetical protein
MFRPYSKNFTFLSNWHATQKPNSESDKTASAINLFYLINTMHDITYKVLFFYSSLDLLKLLETSKLTTLGKAGKKTTQSLVIVSLMKVQITLISKHHPMVKLVKW